MTPKKSIGLVLIILFVGSSLGYLFYVSNARRQAIISSASSAKIGQDTEIATPLQDISNYKAIKEKYSLHLTPLQEEYFEKNRFLLLNEDETVFASSNVHNSDKMLSDFDTIGGTKSEQNRKLEDTVFVTPDVVLHAYSRYLNLTLEELENTQLTTALGAFLNDLHSNLANASKYSTDTVHDRYMNLEAQIVLAQVLLENKNPKKPDTFNTREEEELYLSKDKTVDSLQNANQILNKYSKDLSPDLVKVVTYELDKIYSANAMDNSPLFLQYDDTLKTDYTQFVPQGYYAKKSSLRAYFRTMTYLSNSSYSFKTDLGISDAMLLTEQFTKKSSNGRTPLDSWDRITKIMGLYAGTGDDITYTEMHDFVANVYGSNPVSDQVVASGVAIQNFRVHSSQLRKPEILSEGLAGQKIEQNNTLSYRIFGRQRTFDTPFLNGLTDGNGHVDVKLPSIPSSLFIPAVMGDQRAKDYVGTFLQGDAEFSVLEVQAFMDKFQIKKADVAKITKDEWFASLDGAWLYVLGSFTGGTYGKEYPLYMQALPFADKQIQTFLGSFTEYKHDKPLPIDQSYTDNASDIEGNQESAIPPVVKGFVEPNLEFWYRFNALIDRTQQVFDENDLFKDSPATERLKKFKSICILYTTIATKELHNDAISDDEYELLRTENLKFMSEPFNSAFVSDNSGKVALITDIYTDDANDKTLYEATGTPYLMLVAVGNDQTPRVAVGLVYNHYELTSNRSQRLTDEDWRTWVYDKKDELPRKNFWYDPLFAQ